MSDKQCSYRFPDGVRCLKTSIHNGSHYAIPGQAQDERVAELWNGVTGDLRPKHEDCFAPTETRVQQGMNVDHDPAKSLLKPLPPSEKAELQVSLLNAPIEVPVNVNQAQVLVVRMFESLQRDIAALPGEIWKSYHATRKDLEAHFEAKTRHMLGIEERMKIQHDITHGRLDRMETMFERIATEIDHVASRYAEQAETLKTYKLSLEGIQGLLVEIQATVPLMLGSLENRIMEQRSQLLDNQTSLATRLAQIDGRINGIDVNLATRIDSLGSSLAQIEERLEVKDNPQPPSWDCLHCGQKNSGWSLECGRCERKKISFKPRKAGKRKRVKR